MHHIEHMQYIKAPASIVYEALTTEEGLGAVWTNKLVVKPEVGFVNEFDFNDNYGTRMEVKELRPGRRILWECLGDVDPEWTGTAVSFDLREQNGVTTVDMKHLNWQAVTDGFRSCNYNWAMFLFSLKTYVENGKGMNYQQRKW
ncbi:SRPBCC family protein [Chitinophaga alhagiae]|uniref:SRPBCC family protein n=1 Tax=Chitinophaga alhagiae TaxID=2203219 RepID=UPI000E5BB657|nr:SRPBCC domain-containing protein [Chitinophaga alhagiae]